MQFWLADRADHTDAMQRYVALCERGGSAPFVELVKGAGLTSPFEPGCLEEVVAVARQWLEL